MPRVPLVLQAPGSRHDFLTHTHTHTSNEQFRRLFPTGCGAALKVFQLFSPRTKLTGEGEERERRGEGEERRRRGEEEEEERKRRAALRKKENYERGQRKENDAIC